MLHPVTWPNHGAHKELYLAEEAIGLVRSLDWEVAKGPLWHEQEEEDRKRGEEEMMTSTNRRGGRGKDENYNMTEYGPNYGGTLSVICICHLTRADKVGVTKQRI